MEIDSHVLFAGHGEHASRHGRADFDRAHPARTHVDRDGPGQGRGSHADVVHPNVGARHVRRNLQMRDSFCEPRRHLVDLGSTVGSDFAASLAKVLHKGPVCADEVVQRVLRLRDIVEHAVGRADLVCLSELGQRPLVASLPVQFNALLEPGGRFG